MQGPGDTVGSRSHTTQGDCRLSGAWLIQGRNIRTDLRGMRTGTSNPWRTRVVRTWTPFDLGRSGRTIEG